MEAVIADARNQGVDEFWHLGDSLGYGPFVDEVVDGLFDICTQQVIGNYDLRTLKFPQKKDTWKRTKHPEKYTAFQWAWQHLSERNIKRLQSLPQQRTVRVGDVRIRMTHGGPEAVDEAVGPQTPPERLVELADMTDADILLCGHTHCPFHRVVGNVTILNPGSVGRPEGGDPRAAYAILDVRANRFELQFHRVAYDIDRLARAIHAAGLPENFTEMFKTGQNLDQVQDCRGEAVEGKAADPAADLLPVREYARRCRYEAEHAEHVTRLAQALFNGLADLHQLGLRHLFLLTCAGLLHDIGWIEGQKGHHKTSMRMILHEPSLPLKPKERALVALIARYHRRAVPQDTHSLYVHLDSRDRVLVDLLGGILRVADGLDNTHRTIIRDVDVRIAPEGVQIHCKTVGPAQSELAAAQKKADLLEKALHRRICFTAVPPQVQSP